MYFTTEAGETAVSEMPDWARRSERAVERVDVPPLGEVAPGILENRRPLVILLIARPVIGVVIFFAAAARGWWIISVLSSWVVYGGGITAVHHLVHSGMGLTSRWRQFWLSAIGMLVVESGHALQVTHLAHHRSGSDLPDPEGYIENVSWLAMPLAALRFRYRLALWGLAHSPRRNRVKLELGVHAFVHLSSLALLPWWPDLWVYVTLLHIASFAFAVLAGKGPQTNYGREVNTPYVRVVSTFGRYILFSHDRHLEHHLYPKVPMPRLRQLDPMLGLVWRDLDTVDVRLGVFNRLTPVPESGNSKLDELHRVAPHWVRAGVGTVSSSVTGLLGPVLRLVGGLPRTEAAASLAIQSQGDHELWQRTFAHRTRRSVATMDGGLLRERVLGLVDLWFQHESLTAGGSFKLVAIGRGVLRVPKSLLADINVDVRQEDSTTITVVAVVLPMRLGSLTFEARLQPISSMQ